MPSQAEVQANLERCPRFERCNRNKCPLDYELEKRYRGSKCLWMQEGEGKPYRTKGKPGGIVTYVAGAQMPDELLIHVPAANVPLLNERSKRRWDELSKAHEAAKSSHISDKLVFGGSTVE